MDKEVCPFCALNIIRDLSGDGEYEFSAPEAIRKYNLALTYRNMSSVC